MDWPPNSNSRRERAAALIIVLAFVVLLTGLVLAYFTRATSDRPVAHSSFNQSKADELAQSAMDLVIGALRQEITGPSPTPTPPYFPLPNANMLPMRSGNPPIVGGVDPIPNLIRRSVRSDALSSPALPSLASFVNSTTDPSANGRSVSLPRWNKHYLVPRPIGAIPTDTTPISGASGFTAPDWVILTRNGPAAFSTWNSSLADTTQSNSSYCVGRYAYAIYDEGGLLDANVAGYPSNATAGQYGLKGVSAFADLTVLGLSTNDIDAIVGWRNYVSARQSGNFPNFTLNAANYLASVLSNTNGFMSVPIPSPTPNNMSRTDQQFTTRQSLIQLLVASGLSAGAPSALQYLGTFSRELNAPSWAPTQDASDMGGNNGGGIYAYKTNANSTTAVNRNILGVQVVNSFIRPDGTTAVVGEPLIERRFPLTRLTAITSTGPNTTTNSTIIRGVFQPATTTSDNRYPELPPGGTIQRDFGLLWDSTNNRWSYVGPTGTTVQTAIETLGQVANENPGREPNFFELLKAVILSGSVGMGSGSSGNTFVTADPEYYSASSPTSSDYQIMQIGANIISQWDSSNTPTFVYFGTNELAGIKNLPYLNKLVFKPSWTTVKIRGVNNYQFDAWLLPSLWNPHQNAPGAGTANVRIAMTAGAMTASMEYTGGTLTSSSIPWNPSGNQNQYMTVSASSFGSSPLAPTTVANTGAGSSISQSTDPAPGPYYGFHFTFAGPGTTVTPSNSQRAYPDFGSVECDFGMQVLVGGVTWKTYQRWKIPGSVPNHPLVCQSPPDWTATTLQDPEFVTLDPRTLRFGVWGNAGKQSSAIAGYNADPTIDYKNGTQFTLDSPPWEAVTAMPPKGGTLFGSSTSPNLYLYANNTDASVHYTDLDSVQRLGDFTTLSTTDEMQPALSTDRPLILSGAFQNGVFQSVAELGHIFRDQPWKTLNFTTASANSTVKSADAGLLDVFTLHESSMEAGKASLNTRQPLVLKAILSNALQRLNGAATAISSTQRDSIVTALTNLTSAQPMINKAELVTRLAEDASVTGLGNKEARELVMRAFSDACQTRTWNLMIDVIAQSGRYPPNASTLAGFLVEGEQHYWVHVAIDRFTGQVIDKQIEVVNE